MHKILKSTACSEKYGAPALEANMTLFTVPDRLHIQTMPSHIYCNKDLVGPLTQALENIINRRLTAELKTWDGCFNIRAKRGMESPSLHSWGVAIDINAAWNRFGKKPTMSQALVNCLTDAGFDWGGNWSRPDGMHFQLAQLP